MMNDANRFNEFFRQVGLLSLSVILYTGLCIACSEKKESFPKTITGTFNIPATDETSLLGECEILVKLSDGDLISSANQRYKGMYEKSGEKHNILFEDNNGMLDLHFSYQLLDSLSLRAELTISNTSDSSLNIESITILKGTIDKNEDNRETQVLVTSEDWQDEQITYTLSDGLTSIKSQFTIASDNPSLAGGFLAGKKHFNSFSIKDTLDRIDLKAWGEANGAELLASTSRQMDPLFLSFKDNSLKEMERFADLAAIENDVKLWLENKAVWCTWYAGWNREKMYSYKDGIAEGIEENLPLVKNLFADRGARTMRICDDHIAYGDWDDVTRAFPEGLSRSAEMIREAGLIPGVWYPAYWASTGSKIFEKHPEWFAMEEDGTPYMLRDEGQNRSRLEQPYKFSIFDTSVPEVQHYFENTARIWKERGFRYVTNDFLAFATAPDHYHDPTFSKAEVLRAGMEAVKRGLGDDVFYRTIGAQFGTCMGLSHDVRISGDSHGDKPFAYHRTGAAWFYNHRTWINDPSAIVFMRYGEFRDVEWNKMWVSWIALAGTVMTYGEQLNELPREYINIYKKVFPPLKVAGRPLDLWENRPYHLWGMQPDKGDDSYCLFGIFDLDGKGKRNVKLNLDEIYARSTDHETKNEVPGKYLLWDFWNEELLESDKHELDIAMPNKSCNLFALRKYTGEPQLLGTNGHFSIGAIETSNVKWDAASQTLTGNAKGNGGDTVTLFFHIPDGFQMLKGEVDGAINQDIKVENRILALRIPASRTFLSFSLKFVGRVDTTSERDFVKGVAAHKY